MTHDPKPDRNEGREPVARQFADFEKHRAGKEVNAHDGRMESILKDNAEQLDRKYASGDNGDDRNG